MAAPKYIGFVTVWGIDGTVEYNGIAAADNIPTSIGYRDTIQRHETRGKDAEVVGIKLYNRTPEVTIKFYPGKPAGSGSIAGAKTNNVMPEPGSKVTFAGNAFGALNSTTWLYLGNGDEAQTNEGEAEITLPLIKYATDIAATPNT